MKIPGLRAPDEMVGGIVHFGRMLDKARLQAAGTLPEGYFLGDEDFTWWDARCCRFLHVDYQRIAEWVSQGQDDDSILQACFAGGRKPSPEEIQIWNAFIVKRGWRDESTPGMLAEKESSGFGERDDIVTWVELAKAQES